METDGDFIKTIPFGDNVIREIFKARLKGEILRVAMPRSRKARTQVVLTLIEAKVITVRKWEFRDDALMFHAYEEIFLKKCPDWLANGFLRFFSVLDDHFVAGEEGVLYNLDIQMIEQAIGEIE